ncbi:MAG: PIN domain-containing protein [Thermoleophilaceae bacterium]|nr:PIN domain-containing protein [Thermoleophilaceae bacterium]
MIDEPGSEWCKRVWSDAASPYANSIAYVEVRAALAAAARAKRLEASELEVAKLRFELIWNEIGAIDCSAELIRHAGEVAELALLRGYDAVHLSTALALDAKQSIYMLTWDHELGEAAFDAGMNVIRSGRS